MYQMSNKHVAVKGSTSPSVGITFIVTQRAWKDLFDFLLKDLINEAAVGLTTSPPVACFSVNR